ncbi:MAG: DinB family protein [Pirellula sp.]|jgi:hypothetical protein|nr:DinB family protein [Pirellula sp.]
MNRQLIEQYASGGQRLVQAYWGLTQDELFWQPPDGSWTLHQIAIHMMDSDLIASDRMKRVACMDLPLLVAYDETGFSQLPGVNSIPAFQAIDQFVKNRQMTATILRALPDSAFERCGIHTESGKVSLGYLVESYIRHLDHHLVFIEKKRALIGR